MCLTPVVIILTLFRYMPPVYEGLLEAKLTATGLPPQVYYEEKYYERTGHEGGQLIVENLSDQDWTHLNIQVNKHYQITASKRLIWTDSSTAPAHDLICAITNWLQQEFMLDVPRATARPMHVTSKTANRLKLKKRSRLRREPKLKKLQLNNAETRA